MRGLGPPTQATASTSAEDARATSAACTLWPGRRPGPPDPIRRPSPCQRSSARCASGLESVFAESTERADMRGDLTAGSGSGVSRCHHHALWRYPVGSPQDLA